jgi:hypothetical protein
MEGAGMTLRERIGIDLGGRRPIEEELAWASAHGVRYLDVSLEAAGPAPNAPHLWSDERVAAVRGFAIVHVGLADDDRVIAGVTQALGDAEPSVRVVAAFLLVAALLTRWVKLSLHVAFAALNFCCFLALVEGR